MQIVRLLAAVFLLIGCSSARYYPYGSPAVRIQKMDSAQRPGTEEIVLVADQREYHKYQRFFLETRGADKENIRAQYWQSKLPGKKKLIISVPIFGGSSFPSEVIALRLSEWAESADTNVLLVEGGRSLFDWKEPEIASTEREFTEAMIRWTYTVLAEVKNISILVDWAFARSEIDQNRIGIVGCSMGALVASVAMEQDPRISAGAFVMGSGNPHEIIEQGKFPEAEEFRRRVGKNLGWSPATIGKKLESLLFPINPANSARNIHPSTVLIIDAEFDEYMPKSARDALWIAMKRPERITLQHGHRVSFLALTFLGGNFLDKAVARFFNAHL